MERDLTVIGIIPQYPKHSQQNIYARIKMPTGGSRVCPENLFQSKLRITDKMICRRIYDIQN